MFWFINTLVGQQPAHPPMSRSKRWVISSVCVVIVQHAAEAAAEMCSLRKKTSCKHWGSRLHRDSWHTSDLLLLPRHARSQNQSSELIETTSHSKEFTHSCYLCREVTCYLWLVGVCQQDGAKTTWFSQIWTPSSFLFKIWRDFSEGNNKVSSRERHYQVHLGSAAPNQWPFVKLRNGLRTPPRFILFINSWECSFRYSYFNTSLSVTSLFFKCTSEVFREKLLSADVLMPAARCHPSQSLRAGVKYHMNEWIIFLSSSTDNVATNFLDQTSWIGAAWFQEEKVEVQFLRFDAVTGKRSWLRYCRNAAELPITCCGCLYSQLVSHR